MAVKAEEHACWLAVCDYCGEGDNWDLGGSFHYSSQEEALREIKAAEWTVCDDGRVFCLECEQHAPVSSGVAEGGDPA